MNIIDKVILSKLLKKSNQSLLDIDLASTQEQLDKSVNNGIKGAESLFKRLKSHEFIKKMEENANYQHNLMLLLYKAKFIDSFKGHNELHQQSPFSIALSGYYSSKTTLEKAFFLFATFLTLANLKRAYLKDNIGLEYYLKYHSAIHDLTLSFESFKTNVFEFEYNPKIRDEIEDFFSYITSLIATIQNMSLDNFTKPLFYTDNDLPFWIHQINSSQIQEELSDE